MDKTILIINSGSSSLKFQLLEAASYKEIASGKAEHLNSGRATFTIEANDSKEKDQLDGKGTHVDAIQRLFDELEERGLKKTVKAVGHRVVNGTNVFTEPVLLEDQIIDEIEALKPFAPLHNPAAVAGMRAIQKVMPSLPQVAVFDTSFHQTMPEQAYRYAVPDSWYEKYGVRRYGFHGISYKYVSHRAAELLNIPLEKSDFVIAHIGGGASVAAVHNGKSVDTSMGFTPLQGLVMGTRSGDIDPAVVSYMANKQNKTADEILNELNHQSGVYGLSGGLTSDQRELEEGAEQGHKGAKLAMKVMAYSIAKYIAGMMIALPKVDAIVFTAGIGENSSALRKQICDHLTVFGYNIDEERNREIVGRNGVDGVISVKDTPKIMMVRTNEELMIAEETENVIRDINAAKRRMAKTAKEAAEKEAKQL